MRWVTANERLPQCARFLIVSLAQACCCEGFARVANIVSYFPDRPVRYQELPIQISNNSLGRLTSGTEDVMSAYGFDFPVLMSAAVLLQDKSILENIRKKPLVRKPMKKLLHYKQESFPPYSKYLLCQLEFLVGAKLHVRVCGGEGYFWPERPEIPAADCLLS